MGRRAVLSRPEPRLLPGGPPSRRSIQIIHESSTNGFALVIFDG
jgi:hypothetical protein